MAKLRDAGRGSKPLWQELTGNIMSGRGITGNPLNPFNGLEDMFAERGHPKLAQGTDMIQQLLAMMMGGPGAMY